MSIRINANPYVIGNMGEYFYVLTPEVTAWLEKYDISYRLEHEEVFRKMHQESFMAVSFTDYRLVFEFDEEAVLFKMEWR